MMSNTSDSGDSVNCENKTVRESNFSVVALDSLKEFDQEQLFQYVQKLQPLYLKCKKKLQNFKNRAKLLEKTVQLLNDDKSQNAGENTNEENKDSLTQTEDAQKEQKDVSSPNTTLDFVAEIRKAADEAQHLNGFVYEPTSGLYYDHKTGYYYNAEYGLYYDGNTGCYYNYNQEKNSFEFHSQVPVQPNNTSSKNSHTNNDDDIFDNYVNNDILKRFSSLSISRMRSNALDIAKKYPPSLRLIVKETNVKDLKIGSLYVVTYKGGGLGREGNHDIIIPDVNVSKCHLKFSYDTKQQLYYCIDLGSQNGTLLNGVRMSSSKSESDPQIVKHGSIIQIGLTKLLCHVHEGNTTCGLCEPGLLMETAQEASTEAVVMLTHKEQLRKLQRKYGLENEKFVDVQKNDSSYNDRAATRRTQVGSSTDNEKTQTACVNTEISSENKGFKMLANMGWNKGEALGKTNASTGLLEPINVASNEGTKGLGCNTTITKQPTFNIKKLSALKKTQERYQKADIFYDNEDSD
ncbi:angiogenic factor with G patch and FHA domains 1-like isoform X2 [Teleopsis dalmanni]|uniref:angiogenic factor with G patch and FHA domains 1 isoform X2 n=1 Tax=Teleopsis dalmanni TaxID=139649 RepID=UPI0018CE5E5A|nr:angiogenic factor with G patch and FHA domains 1 isoform X2 [Teleopsis dalmanni]XP_037945279.1 angiogenic factor with G patch and FHA domains 1-like isoform X2 [Teleopsis dalmanni]